MKPKTARSLRGEVIDDNYVLSLNLKWLLQLFFALASLVYAWWQIENRISLLEQESVVSNEKIEGLLEKHIHEETQARVELEEKLKFYEKEFNINPLSWGRKKRGKK